MAESDGFPDLPDFDLPDIEDVLPDVFDEKKEDGCPVCNYLEATVCRPHAKVGDPHECAVEIMQARTETEGKPREERVARLMTIFEKYQIDPNASIGNR